MVLKDVIGIGNPDTTRHLKKSSRVQNEQQTEGQSIPKLANKRTSIDNELPDNLVPAVTASTTGRRSSPVYRCRLTLPRLLWNLGLS